MREGCSVITASFNIFYFTNKIKNVKILGIKKPETVGMSENASHFHSIMSDRGFEKIFYIFSILFSGFPLVESFSISNKIINQKICNF